ncbi:MAG: DUF2797 domain-containing protein [Weeksellaceae bacterium]|nr:DUF2797 domain-containing protein [Weeksellaceae bacterium]
MKLKGKLLKMFAEMGEPIQYYLTIGADIVDMNALIGRQISMTHLSNSCLGCGLDKPLYQFGYCQSCFFTLPQAAPSIINPELSTAHLGKEQRNLEWEKKFELQPHVVYLANSGGLKVGVTRKSQIPTRFIDQGASQVLVIAETTNRYEAGVIEVELKKHFADKTNWRSMLSNVGEISDLYAVKERVYDEHADVFPEAFRRKTELLEFHYPVAEYPQKLQYAKFNGREPLTGELDGIRGQYLYLDKNRVFNVRSHQGLVVDMHVH